MTARQALRRLITRVGYTMVPGAYDTLTARLVEQAGFEAVYLTGGGYSRASGYPDLGLLTQVENARWIRLTVQAGPIPVIPHAHTRDGNTPQLTPPGRCAHKCGRAHSPPPYPTSPERLGNS